MNQVFVITLNDSVMGASLTKGGVCAALDTLARKHHEANRHTLAGNHNISFNQATYEWYRKSSGCYWSVRNTTLYP